MGEKAEELKLENGYTAKPVNWLGILPGYYVKHYVDGKVMIEQFLDAESEEDLKAYFSEKERDQIIFI